MDHRAFLLHNVTKANMKNCSGVFYNSHWSLDECRNGIWQAIRYMIDHTNRQEKRQKKNTKSDADQDVQPPLSPTDPQPVMSPPSTLHNSQDLWMSDPDLSPESSSERPSREQQQYPAKETPEPDRIKGYEVIDDTTANKARARLLKAIQLGKDESEIEALRHRYAEISSILYPGPASGEITLVSAKVSDTLMKQESENEDLEQSDPTSGQQLDSDIHMSDDTAGP
jgi:hypothetical protein